MKKLFYDETATNMDSYMNIHSMKSFSLSYLIGMI